MNLMFQSQGAIEMRLNLTQNDKRRPREGRRRRHTDAKFEMERVPVREPTFLIPKAKLR
jgi:hypothetical protein